MSWFPAPSVAEERTDALRRLHEKGVTATPWRSNGLLLRLVFSVLTIVALFALFGFLAVFSLPKFWFTAAAALGTAEWLIRKQHFFKTGVESTLFICGMFALIGTLPSSGSVEAILVFALAAALSGWRLRDALFGVCAVMLVIVYVAVKWNSVSMTMIVAALCAVAAGVALRRAWQRPSTNVLFAGLVLALPVTGYLATIAMRIFHTYASSTIVAVILAATSLAMLAMGYVWRDRVLLVSGTIAMLLAVVEVQERVGLAAEAKFIGLGLLLIAVAASFSRALRDAVHGFVIKPVRVSVYDEAMQIGGILHVAPHAAPASAHAGGPQLADSAGATDKSFGGAGAGADY
ncbi:MAG: hypothetical protein QOK37_2658 [Thermoanaerobaculia bacterium]|jgi:hypothetical protein|nr:hypothetical protein [Thermoanaerobaculia bacterium]